MFGAVPCQVGWVGRQSIQIRTHILRLVEETITDSRHPIISGHTFNTGVLQHIFYLYRFLFHIDGEKHARLSNTKFDVPYDLKKEMIYSLCVYLRAPDSVSHAALWMVLVAKKRHLSRNSANWPEWPLRTRWIVTSTVSSHLSHSSARSLVKDLEQIQKHGLFSTIHLFVTSFLVGREGAPGYSAGYFSVLVI